jgi:hypothetical protein
MFVPFTVSLSTELMEVPVNAEFLYSYKTAVFKDKVNSVTGYGPCWEGIYNTQGNPRSINVIERLSRRMLSFPLPKGGEGRVEVTGS